MSDSNFQSAKDVYLEKKIGGRICGRCKYEGNDTTRRPLADNYYFCEQCMADLSIGTEKLVRQSQVLAKRWLGNK